MSLYYSFLRKSKAGLVLPDPVDVPHIEDGVSMTGPQSSRPDHFDHDSESDFVQDDDFDQNGGSDFDQYNDFDHQDHFDQDYKSENVGAVSPILLLIYSHVASATRGTHQETL